MVALKRLDDIKRILRAGADKISICTPAIENPSLITEGAKKFGSQCIVVAIDAKRKEDGTYEAIYTWG